ncbi:DUF4352 domain-containing protein [Nonomuraea sp. NPDC050310]|uniref:DUF4352 domain-containing protein n=1 Tax=unclassified Nonomuraea TaxID=2593643 RepID=UPI0033FC7F05
MNEHDRTGEPDDAAARAAERAREEIAGTGGRAGEPGGFREPTAEGGTVPGTPGRTGEFAEGRDRFDPDRPATDDPLLGRTSRAESTTGRTEGTTGRTESASGRAEGMTGRTEDVTGRTERTTGRAEAAAGNGAHRVGRTETGRKGGNAKWWWLAVAAAAVIGLLWWGGSRNTTPEAGPAPTAGQATDGQGAGQAVPSPTDTAASSPAASPTGTETGAGAGAAGTVAATEEPLRFTVGKPELMESVGTAPTTKEAEGHFAVIPVTAENVGSEEAVFSGAIQSVTGSDGQTYLPDVSILRYLPDSSRLYEPLAPGASASGRQMFDLPDDVTPVSMTLHAERGSKGVTVDLP